MLYQNSQYPDGNYQTPALNNTYRKYILIVIILFVLGLIIWLTSRFSYIEVNVANSNSGNFEYQVYRDGDLQFSQNSPEKSIKKLVPRGNYEVKVSQSTKTGLAFIKSGGFFGTNNKEVTLASEKKREYIGNKTLACMYLPYSQLVSYPCNGDISDAFLHVAANQSTPPYTRQVNSPYTGKIEGFIYQNNNQYVVIKAPEISNDQAPHAAYLINNEGEVGKAIPLNNLKEGQDYIIKPFKTGFLAIDTSLTSAVYYTDLNSKPEVIAFNLDQQDKINSPYILDTLDNKLAVGITEEISLAVNAEGEDPGTNSSSGQDANSKIIIIKDNKKTEFEFKETFDDIKLCGNEKLCTLLDGILSVFDISGKKQKLLFSVDEVSYLAVVDNILIATKEKEVIRINVDSQTGSVDFSSKESSACGLQSASDNYVLCLTDSRGIDNALLISDGTPTKIENYVNQLLKITEINSVTAYKDFIYISPDLGEYKYNPDTNSFGYDPQIKSNVNTKINELIKGFQADTKYIFINPLDN